MVQKHAADEERVLLVQGLHNGESTSFKSFTLPDPKTGRPQGYLYCNGLLQEVNRFKQEYAAWFAGGKLLADGGMYLCTPVDPLLMLLPALDRGREKGPGCPEGRFRALDELLYDPASPGFTELLQGGPGQGPGSLTEQLACVCDVKNAGGDCYWRLNDERVLAWLMCKLQQAQEALAPHTAGMDPGPAAAYALALLGEYVAEPWLSRLAACMGAAGMLPASPSGQAGKRDAGADAPGGAIGDEPADKRPKVEPAKPAPSLAQKQAGARAAALAKQAVGSKKISSFFAKPPPKPA